MSSKFLSSRVASHFTFPANYRSETSGHVIENVLEMSKVCDKGDLLYVCFVINDKTTECDISNYEGFVFSVFTSQTIL